MANRRMLSRQIVVDKQVIALSDFAKLLYTWCIPFLDDFGRMTGDVEEIRYLVMPFSKKPNKNFENALEEMSKKGEENRDSLVTIYESSGVKVLQYRPESFDVHQSGIVSKRTVSRYPDLTESSRILYFGKNSRSFQEIPGNSVDLNLTKPNLTKLNPRPGPETMIEIPEELKTLDGFLTRWKEWIQHRLEKRAPLTVLTMRKQLKKLQEYKAEGYDPGDVIDDCINAGWQGLFVSKSLKKTDEKKGSKEVRVSGKQNYYAFQTFLTSQGKKDQWKIESIGKEEWRFVATSNFDISELFKQYQMTPWSRR